MIMSRLPYFAVMAVLILSGIAASAWAAPALSPP